MTSCWKLCFGRSEEDTERVRVINHSSQGLHDVPGHLFLHERTLEELILTSNRIEDLPLPLFHCHALTVLNMSQNMLSVIPNAIGCLTSLRNLDLSRNCIEDIPDDLKKCRKLVVLNLSVNPLVQFPDVVTKLISLEELYLNDIQLDFLPANTCRLVNLRILELRENRLSNLPKAIARLNHITRLDIGLNDFWNIPEVVGSLQTLEELWIDLNYIREIPKFIGNLHRLTHFESGDNSLVSVHDYFSRCLHLVDLTLSGCRIEVFPENLHALSELVTLRLDRNKLERLPLSIGSLRLLEQLNMGYNNLKALPGSIGLLRRLTFLCIDNNCLEHLPKEIGSCTKLSVLSVQANKLTEIPAEVGSLNSLSVLDLRSNRLMNLPMSLLKLDNLSALWLSHNQCKPITPLVKELDARTSTNVLTCYLLPQEESCQPASVSKKKNEDNNIVEAPTVCRITFAAGSSDRPNLLIRAPTPYPKRLRELAKTARSVCYSQLDEGHEEKVKPQGRQPKCDEIRTAIVKKNEVAPVLTYSSEEGSDSEDAKATIPFYIKPVALIKSTADSARISMTRAQINCDNSLSEQHLESTTIDIQLPQKPPPYHIAAAYSKKAMMFAQPSSNDGESDITDYKLPVYSQEDANEVKSIPLKDDSFAKAIPLYTDNEEEPLVNVCVISETVYTTELNMYNDDLSVDDSAVEMKLNGKYEAEENQYSYCESLQENDSGSSPYVCPSDVSQLEEASNSSSLASASIISHGISGNMYMSSPKCSPYENVSFEYSDIENSRFQIRKVKDTLPRITREKSMLKVKKRHSTRHKDNYLNFEWDFGSSDKVNIDRSTEKNTVKSGAASVVKKCETAVRYDSDEKSVSVSIPGSSHDSPSSACSFLFDVNGNSCNDSPSKTSGNTIPDTEICYVKKSPSKRNSKRSKTPWIFGQHKNPVVMQVEVPKLTSFNLPTLEQKKSGLFISSVGNSEPICSIFQVGDKIIEIEGINVNSVITVDMVYELMLTFSRSFTVLISRQT